MTVGTYNSDTVILSPGHFLIERGYDPSVRVPDQVLKCVAFIGAAVRSPEGEVFGDLDATGFFVSVRSKHFPELRYPYFVTAKHVANALKDRTPYILVNSKTGEKPIYLKNWHPYWFFHPSDPTADVAVLQIAEQPGTDHLAVLTKDFVTAEDIANRDWVDIGDEAFMTGLFTPAPGEKRNMPIVRHGNVAMIPDHQIQTELGYSDVFLIEARSIGGLSGSPVFVRRTEIVKLQLPDKRITELYAPGPFKLLGVMQGHWDIKESEINKAAIQHVEKHGVNLGIGIVTPATKILEILLQPGMEKIRELSDEDLGRVRGLVPRSDTARKRDEQPFTQTQFEAALTKATRKLSEQK